MRRKFDGERLNRARVHAGYYTYASLAKVIGVSHQSVRAWEKGITPPSLENLCQLSKLLDVPVEFLDGSGPDMDLPIDGAVMLPKLNNPNVALRKAITASVPNNTPQGSGDDAKSISVPVYDCFDSVGSDYGPSDYADVPVSLLPSSYSTEPDKMPFEVSVSDNSMSAAGIMSGMRVLISPTARILDGNPALVELGGSRMIRWIFPSAGELRAATRGFRDFTYSPQDIRIIGKVILVIGKPANGSLED